MTPRNGIKKPWWHQWSMCFKDLLSDSVALNPNSSKHVPTCLVIWEISNLKNLVQSPRPQAPRHHTMRFILVPDSILSAPWRRLPKWSTARPTWQGAIDHWWIYLRGTFGAAERSPSLSDHIYIYIYIIIIITMIIITHYIYIYIHIYNMI